MAWCVASVFSFHGTAAAVTAVLFFLTAAVGSAWFLSAPLSFGRNRLVAARPTCALRSMSGPSSKDGSDKLSAVCDLLTVDHFRGKNILITGASGGLGRDIARQLARCGASTLILSGRNTDKLKNVAEECAIVHTYYHGDEGAKGGRKDVSLNIKTIPCDLSDSKSVENMGEEALSLCAELGGHGNGNSGVVDVLINNGGVSSRSSFLETDFSVDELIMRINFLSGSQLAKAVAASMVSRGSGAIIWISSVQGLFGIPNRTSYAASKFAVQGYCEALRAELASSGVTVHVASPGYIRTDLSKAAIRGDGKKHGKMDEATANGADPTRVAVAILDLVAKGKTDFVVAATPSARAAIWLRLLAPKFLEKKLAERFEKSR